MVDSLKTFNEGEYIYASETNSNNQYLLSKLSDNAAQVQTYVEGEISSIQSNVASVQATLQANIDAANTNANSKLTAELSKSGNGYCKLSNGLIIQWGSTGVTKNKTITLPTPFNNTDYKVTLIEIGGNTGWTRAAINVSIVSKTQWKIARVDSCEHHYIAIGY